MHINKEGDYPITFMKSLYLYSGLFFIATAILFAPADLLAAPVSAEFTISFADSRIPSQQFTGTLDFSARTLRGSAEVTPPGQYDLPREPRKINLSATLHPGDYSLTGSGGGEVIIAYIEGGEVKRSAVGYTFELTDGDFNGFMEMEGKLDAQGDIWTGTATIIPDTAVGDYHSRKGFAAGVVLTEKFTIKLARFQDIPIDPLPAGGSSKPATKIEVNLGGVASKVEKVAEREIVAMDVKGDVELVRVNGERVTLNVGTTIQPGDRIDVGFGGEAELLVPGGELVVGQATSLTFDEFTLGEADKDPHRLRTRLLAGTVKARVPRTASIRSDFSVSTPTMNASIRGSEMIIAHDAESKETKLFVTEDKAYVSRLGETERELLEGEMLEVDEGGFDDPRPYTGEELEATGLAEKGGWSGVLVVIVVLVILALAFLFFKKRMQTS